MNVSQRSFFRASLTRMQDFRSKDYESDREPMIITNDGPTSLEITQKDGRISSLVIEMVQATAIPMCAICWVIDSPTPKQGEDSIARLRIF